MHKVKILCAVTVLVLLALTPAWPGNTILAENENASAQAQSRFVPGRILVQFRPETVTMGLRGHNVVTEVGARDAGEIRGTGVRVIELPAGANEEVFLQAFRSRQEVEFAELDQLVPPEDMLPNDPGYIDQWHLPKIAAPAAWSVTTGASSVIVAICDTGVDGNHPDLAPKMVQGWNIYDNNSDTSDIYGHGTKVAGTVAACSNNSLGVASVAWNCLIMPMRISGPDGWAAFSDIANGITWAADHGARVANASYKATTSSSVASAARYMQSKGGVVTISAGNDGAFDTSVDNPYVLTVSATDSRDQLYSWSATGNNIDLAAPGYVYTTTRGGGYSFASGTSFSAPIVAGVAALVLSNNPGLSGAEAQEKVKQSADDCGYAGWDTSYGAGRVNAARSVDSSAGPTPGDTSAPAVSISSPAAGATVSGAVTVQVTASDNVGVTSVSLSLDGAPLGTSNSSSYTFPWNTTAVSDGPHTLTASASDAAGNVSSASRSVTVSNAVSDATAPAVAITSPSQGAKVSAMVSVYVAASDNVGVVRVELYVDGALASTSFSAPFTNKWNSKKSKPGAHTLQCRGYDAAGNVGLSSTITVYR